MSAIGRLVGLREAEDLDFKRQFYDATTKGRRELASDVAAFANAGGGLILIGIEEDGSGGAVEVTPQPLAPDVTLVVEQVVADRVVPRPSFDVVPIEAGDGLKVLLISVQPGVLQPYAVVEDINLRFPLRIGTTRRWMTLSEVTDRFRRRFTVAATTEASLVALHEKAVDVVPRTPREHPEAWLTLSAVPDHYGLLELRRDIPDKWRDWVNALLADFPSWQRHPVRFVPGFKSLRGTQSANLLDEPYSAAAHLRTDGAGYLLLGVPAGRAESDDADVLDEYVIADLINGVRILAHHAGRCGATGDFHVSAELVTAQKSMALYEYSFRDWHQVWSTYQTGPRTGIAHHTTPLDLATDDGPELIAFVRLITLDLFSAFGSPEPRHLTPEGHLLVNNFQSDWQARVEAWSERAGVRTTP